MILPILRSIRIYIPLCKKLNGFKNKVGKIIYNDTHIWVQTAL